MIYSNTLIWNDIYELLYNVEAVNDIRFCKYDNTQESSDSVYFAMLEAVVIVNDRLTFVCIL